MSEILTLLIASIVGLLSAWFSARWAVRGALQERWWDRKLHAYNEIIEALHDLNRYAEKLANDYETREMAPANPKKPEFRERYIDAQWRIRKATDIGPFVISKHADRVLQALREQAKTDCDEAPHEVVLAAECESYRAALVAIRTCARADLNINRQEL